MPPRVVKRGGASGQKTAARARRGQKPQSQPPEEELPKLVDDEKPIAPAHDAGAKSTANGSPSLKKEEEFKESVDEYEKHERLELDDNEPEYEAEEYGGVDDDDREIEQEDLPDLGDEVDEEVEEEEADEDEGDLVEEELEDVHEELEGDDHAAKEAGHAEVDAAEEEEHHEVVKERRKRKEFEVFVGGLDKDAIEDDLRKVFSQVGEIVEIRLMMNPQTKKNKGFAFLRFATIEQAKRAVAELKNPVINGKKCGVTPSQDSDTLFLGNICKTWTKEALKEKLKHYGVENVDELTLVEDSNNEGKNRGFAFLEFPSRADAMDAFKRLLKRDVLFGVDRPAKVSFADSFIDPGDEIMAQVKTVFIDGLLASWDEDRVREILKKYGVVEKIELARNMPSARRKDFGFVTFDTHDSAVTCAKSINNSELGEGDNKVKVRARLSRPLQRGKGKHSSHGDYRSGLAPGRVPRGPRAHPAARSIPLRATRSVGSHIPPPSMKRHVGLRDRRPPVMSMPTRSRPVAPLPFPPPRSYDRRAPPPTYPKRSMKREYSRHDEIPPPRSRAAVDYSSRPVPERRVSYRDEYFPRGSGYSDIPRGSSRAGAPRRAYEDDGYGQSYDRPPPSYRESRPHDYEPLSGSKRPYSSLDDANPRYVDAGARHSRTRLDYDLGPGAPRYGDEFGERFERSSLGYGTSRGSISSQDSHGLYNSRHGMGYGGSYNGSDVGGMYQSSYGADYVSRSSGVGGSSYSSMYSSRGMGNGGYLGPGGSRSYY